MRHVRRQLVLVLVLVLGVTPGLAGTGTAQEGPPAAVDPGGDITLVRTDEEAAALDGVDLAIRLSQQVNPSGAELPRVVLASAETFADALSAAVLQSGGPLLLTPPASLPPALRAELLRLQPQEVVILGGTGAVSAAVEEDVARLGLRTSRLAGATRTETAVAVARAAAATSETAIIVRASDATGGDGSAAWADSVTAGALAAGTGVPILLTQTDVLTASTRAHLADSAVKAVLIIGGQSAVSRSVEQELLGSGYLVDRVFGHNRVETALAVAQARGVPATGRAVLVPGSDDLGWQVGIAAAQHAARTGAAILPTAGDDAIPVEVAARLAGATPVGLTCLVSRTTCEAARALAGMPSLPLVSYHPAPDSALANGEVVVVGVDDPDRLLSGEITLRTSSGCGSSGLQYLPEGSATFDLTVPVDEAVGDQPPAGGPVPVQPAPGTGEATGPQAGSATGSSQPVEGNESSPGPDHVTTCTVTTSMPQRDGGTMTDVASYQVVDLHPHFRATNFRQVEDEPVTFLDRSHGIISGWAWDFGDGGRSTEQDPTHTYRDRGCLDVDLTVTSPFAHWASGRAFQDRVTRTLAVHPADADTHVEVLVLDAAADDARLIDEEIEATGPGGRTVRSTSGSDGRAAFTDLGQGDWTFRSVVRPDNEITQRVIAGSTLCPVLKVGPIGDLDVRVLDSDGRAIVGAAVSISREEETRASGLTDAQGHFLAVDLPVGSYEVVATLAGVEIGRATAGVVQDEVTPVEIKEPPPPAPAPDPDADPDAGT